MKDDHRFGDRRIKELLPEDVALSWAEGPSESQCEVPDGDRGLVGERDDCSLRGKFLVRFEHISRYSEVARADRGTVLDIGCGTGYGSAMLSSKSKVVALDISPSATDFARRSHPGPEYMVGDAAAIPLAGGNVDAITAFEVIEHLAEPGRFLDECRRVLKAGGSLVMSSPNPAHFTNRLKKTFLGVPIPPRIWAGNIYHVREFTHDQMVSLLSSKGFEVTRTRGQTIALPYLRGPFTYLGKGEVYDWTFSRLGAGFPRIAYTVVYSAISTQRAGEV